MRSPTLNGGLLVTIVACALTTAGCPGDSPDAPPLDPAARAALEVFDLAQRDDPDGERLEALFGPFEEGPPADLHDALGALAAAGPPEIVGRERIEDLDREVVDLEAPFDGEGTGRFSVQLTVRENGDGYRVTWFQGPGVDWPPRRRPRDDGLSTSPIE